MNKGITSRRQGCSSEHIEVHDPMVRTTESSFVHTSDENAPYYPFTGPATLSVTVNKKDAPRGFKFIAKQIKNEMLTVGLLSMDTPGSTVDRAMKVGFSLDMEARSAELELNSPWADFLAKGTYTSRPKFHKFTGTVRLDGREHSVLMTCEEEEKEKDMTVWTSLIELEKPEDSALIPGGTTKFSINTTLSRTKSEVSAHTTINTGLMKIGLKPNVVDLKFDFVNSRVEKSLSASAAIDDKGSYSGTVKLQHSGNKQHTQMKLQPTVLISAPGWRIFLLSGQLDYKTNKLFKTDLTITMDKNLKKPINLEAKITRIVKKTDDRFRGIVKLNSQFANIKLNSLTINKDNKRVSNKLKVDYVIPLIKNKSERKNKLTFFSKFHDRSTKALTRFDLSLNCDNKLHPDLNFNSKADLLHKNGLTKSSAILNHGAESKNFKDKTKQIRTEFSVSHKLKKNDFELVFDALFIYPLKAMEYQIKGKHEHHLKGTPRFETYATTIYGKGKAAELRIIGENLSKNGKMNMQGSMDISLPKYVSEGREVPTRRVTVSTVLEQNKEKDYVHTVNVQLSGAKKHAMVSRLRMPTENKPSEFEFNSKLDLALKEPTSLTVKVDNSAKDAVLSGLYQTGILSYSAELASTYQDIKYQTVSWDIVWPERHVKGSLEGGRKGDREENIKLISYWDADRDMSKKIEGEMYHVYQEEPDFNAESVYTLSTPFNGHRKYVFESVSKITKEQFKEEKRIVWREAENEFSYSLTALRPASSKRFNMQAQIKTPMDQLRQGSIGVAHKWDGSKEMSITLDAVYNDDNINTVVLASNSGNSVRNIMSGSLAVTSSVPQIRDILLKFEHVDDGHTFGSEALYRRNGYPYRAIMNATYVGIKHQMTTNANLQIDLPSERPIIITWVHSNTLIHLNSSLQLQWRPEYNTKLIVGAKGSKAENDYAVDLKVIFPGHRRQDEFDLNLRQNMMSDYRGSAYWDLSSRPDLESTVSYSFSDKRFEVSYTGEGRQSTVETSYEKMPYTALVKTTWRSEDGRRDHTIRFDASVNTENYYSANAKLITPWEAAKNIDVQGSLKKKSTTKWEFDSLISLGVRQQISADIKVDTDGSSLTGTIKTPFEKMSKMEFDWKHNQSKEKVTNEAHIEIKPLFKKVTFEHTTALEGSNIDSKLFLGLPDTEIKSLEVMFDNTGVRRGHNTNLNIKYQMHKEIDLKVKTRYHSNKFPDKSKLHIDLSTPFSEFPSMALKTELETNKDGKWIGLIDLKTGLEAMEDLTLSFEHALGSTSSTTDLEVTSTVFETVTAGAHFDWGSKASANVTFVAPSIGRTSVGFVKKAESWSDFQNKIFAEFDDQQLDLEVGLKHQEDETRGWLLYSLPSSQESSVKANIHRHGRDFSDIDVGGFLQLGKYNKPFNVSVKYAYKPLEKFALGTTLETPKTKHVSYLYELDMSQPGTYSGTMYTKVGQKFLLDLKASLKRNEHGIDQTAEAMYRLGDKSMRLGSSLNCHWSENIHTGSLTSYKDDDKMILDFNREFGDVGKKYKENIELVMNTPFDGFSDVGVHATLDSHKDGHKHGGTLKLEYMDGKEAELKIDLDTPNKQRADLTAVLSIPVKGYENNKLTYNHVIRKDSLKADAEFVTGKGHRLSGDLDFKDNTLSFTVNGPVEQFETLAINAQFNPQEKKVTGDVWYQLSNVPNRVSLKYDIALSAKPVTLDFVLTNIVGKVTNLHIEHDGSQLRSFNNVIDLKSEAEQLNDVHIETSWQLRSPFEIELHSEMTSNHPDYDRAELKFNRRKQFDEQISELELEWSPAKKIIILNGFTFDEDKENPSAKITFNINTPWEELKDVYLEFSHRPTKKTQNENVMLRYNERDLLDVNFVYSTPNNRHRGVLTFQKPQPMTFSAEGEAGAGLFDGKLNLDWDKDSPVGRVEIVSSFSDKSTDQGMNKEFKFKVNHPVRILGVDFLWKAGQNEFRSAGLYTWDEARGNTFSYDLGWANRTTWYSRMLEGHCKVGIPQRSVKYQGSFSDTGTSVTTTSAFNWHADQDDTKKVTMTTTVKQNDNSRSVDLNINVPYINKQLNLGAITKGGYGRNLLDTKAEISYSSDPRKTITVTSSISNSVPESSGDGYNYTLDLGFKHPVSGIDLALVSHMANVNMVKSAGSDFSFINVNGGRQNVNFFMKMDSRNRRFEAVVSSPIKSLGVEGQATTSRQDRTLVSAVAFEDGKEALKLGMVIDPKRKHLDMELNYDQDDPNKLLSVSGGFINDSALTLDVTTQLSRRAPAQTETLVAVRLNSSQLLHTRIQWRPNVDAEIREFLATRLTEFSYKTNDFLKKAVQIIGQEVKGKYSLVSDELKAELSPVFDLMEQEMGSLNSQLSTLLVKFRRFHQQNHMHIKDMGDNIAKVFQDLNEQILRIVWSYRSYYEQVNQATEEWLEHLNSFPVAQTYQEFVNDAAYMLKEVESALEDLLTILVEEVGRYTDYYYREYMTLSRTIDRKLDGYARSVHELPLYRKMVEQRSLFGEEVPAWVHWYDTVYLKTQEFLQEQFHDFMARDEFQHMYAVASEVLGQVKHYNKENSLGTAMQRVSEMTKNILLIELGKLKKTIMDFRKSRVTVYDPEKGELQFEMFLPIPLKSLYEAPELNPERYIAHARRLVETHVDKVKDMLPSSNFSLWDLYYDNVPSTNPSDWVPPFDASAYLIGSQHVITFDKHEYDFLSKCSHVLTRDTLKDKFSVVVNYNSRPKKDGVESICFTIEDNHVEVSHDYKLTVNNQGVEMPYTSDKVKVVREGDFVRVQYIHGLEVLCNPKLDLYKVTVSGWYHGRLAGLLGHYDNEQHSDLSLLETASDFEVNKKRCTTSNIAAKPQPEADKQGICLRVFSSTNSKFSPCFKQVDPSGFRQLCETYVGKMSVEEAARLASEQYRFVCQGHGVFISALQHFATCGTVSENFQVQGNEAKYQSADVVFVMEDVKCNQWARSSLPSIVTHMDAVLVRKGFTGNRFGLEGYGGVDVDDVSVRTIDGQHFGGAELFLKALETLRFSENVGAGDLARALREAAKYPYRAGVAKVLVLAPCSKCEVSLLDRTLISNLAAYGFQVHVLQDKGYSTEGFTVFGTNKDRFFPREATDFNGVLRNERTIDQRDGRMIDFCQDVTDQTGGAIFDTTFIQGKGATQRQFEKAFSSHVALSTKLPVCQECQCDANTGRARCTLCSVALPYFNSIPTLPEAVGALYDVSHHVKNYLSNTVESARSSVPDNYLILGM
ncbi:hypothetical protein EGW08_010025 [Elysia chlorotica]|uniref:VWFD domain-containing protein n=1 Tax=Elysia chlorotica TaxID=188477 RepID=A0A3S1BJD0_ELYCH|nr:hypothetical protein EGW08_010025 [Elysia chlorotica]